MSDLGARRHAARERGIEILYEAHIKGRPVEDILAALPTSPDAYTVRLVMAASAHEEAAHALISQHAIDWPLERMAIVDRLIMTMAIGELLLEDAPPVAVVLDESVELARTYSTDDSPQFVNGVLAAVVDDLPR